MMYDVFNLKIITSRYRRYADDLVKYAQASLLILRKAFPVIKADLA